MTGTADKTDFAAVKLGRCLCEIKAEVRSWRLQVETMERFKDREAFWYGNSRPLVADIDPAFGAHLQGNCAGAPTMIDRVELDSEADPDIARLEDEVIACIDGDRREIGGYPAGQIIQVHRLHLLRNLADGLNIQELM